MSDDPRIVLVEEVMDKIVEEQIQYLKLIADGLQREISNAIEKVGSLRIDFSSIPLESEEWQPLTEHS